MFLLMQVWAIADSKRQGFLGLKEFITAMQVVVNIVHINRVFWHITFLDS